MRNFLLSLFCFPCFVKSYSQTVTNSYGRVGVEITKEKKPTRIDIKVVIKSAFPGGDSSWVQSLEKNIDRSIWLNRKVKKGIYVVSVVFIVIKDGSLAEIRCVSDPGFGMCEEVVRVIKKSPKWFPAPQPVKVREYRVTQQ